MAAGIEATAESAFLPGPILWSADVRHPSIEEALMMLGWFLRRGGGGMPSEGVEMHVIILLSFIDHLMRRKISLSTYERTLVAGFCTCRFCTWF